MGERPSSYEIADLFSIDLNKYDVKGYTFFDFIVDFDAKINYQTTSAKDLGRYQNWIDSLFYEIDLFNSQDLETELKQTRRQTSQ